MAKLWVLWLVVFISLMGFGITVVPFPIVAEQYGASKFWMTFGSSGMFSLFQVVATPLWGRLSDRIGRKPVLVVSLIGTFFAYLWMAYADGLWSLVAARAFAGIMSGNLSAAYAYVSDITEPQDRAKNLGIIGSAFGLGFAAGPVIGGALGKTAVGATLFMPGLASALLTLVAIAGAVFFLKESLPADKRAANRVATANDKPGSSSPWGLLGSKPVLRNLSILALVVSCGVAAMQSVYPFWARDMFNLKLDAVGWHFGAFAVISAFSQAVLTAILVKRFGEKRVALLSVVGVTVGLLLFGAAHSLWMTYGALLVFGLSLGVFTPSVTSLVSFEADPANRGAVMGLFNAGSSAGRVLGPAYAGIASEYISNSAPFLISAMLTVAGWLILTRTRTHVVQRASPA